MSEELWRDIPGYEGLYQVSSFGRVKSLYRIMKRKRNFITINERFLKLGLNRGYATIALANRGNVKYYQVHRLVAQAFIPNPNNLPCVNHKDENPSNNHVDNLEWCTKSYNNSYNEARIKAAVPRRIPILQYDKKGRFIKEWSHAREAAETLNLNKHAIYECCVGRSKTSGGYIWKRKEHIQKKH